MTAAAVTRLSASAQTATTIMSVLLIAVAVHSSGRTRCTAGSTALKESLAVAGFGHSQRFAGQIGRFPCELS